MAKTPKPITDKGKIKVLVEILKMALKYGEMSEDGINRGLPEVVCVILNEGVNVGMMLSKEDIDFLRAASDKSRRLVGVVK